MNKTVLEDFAERNWNGSAVKDWFFCGFFSGCRAAWAGVNFFHFLQAEYKLGSVSIQISVFKHFFVVFILSCFHVSRLWLFVEADEFLLVLQNCLRKHLGWFGSMHFVAKPRWFFIPNRQVWRCGDYQQWWLSNSRYKIYFHWKT